MKEALEFAVAVALIVMDELSASLTDDGEGYLSSDMMNFIELMVGCQLMILIRV